jgi:hypothetical protein
MSLTDRPIDASDGMGIYSMTVTKLVVFFIRTEATQINGGHNLRRPSSGVFVK